MEGHKRGGEKLFEVAATIMVANSRRSRQESCIAIAVVFVKKL